MTMTTNTKTKTSNNVTKTTFVSSPRRYIAPPRQLQQYNATPLLLQQQQPPQQQQSQQQQSQQPQSQQNDLVGISIHGWDVATSQGPIGDSIWFETMTESLERLAQPQPQEQPEQQQQRRKIVLPEMVYPNAHVFIEHTTRSTTTTDTRSMSSVDNNDNNNGNNNHNDDDGLIITWDAIHALQEWSHAHENIPLPDDNVDKDKDDDLNGATAVTAADATATATTDTTTTTTDDNDISSLVTSFRRVSCGGVNILESNDAKLWKQKGRQSVVLGGAAAAAVPLEASDGNGTTTATATAATATATFHYDWTYSTPFVGNCCCSSTTLSWQHLDQSGMNMSLLTNQSIPILYFDQIDVYEDDLHDNGYVQYNVKVRVMPTCIYILARLFVRVDHVLIRVRDARWLVDFSQTQGQQTTIFRDITWRQVEWDQLSTLNLPQDVRDWTSPTEQSQSQHQTSSSAAQEMQRFQSFLNKIPIVPDQDMPSNLPRHSKLVVSQT